MINHHFISYSTVDAQDVAIRLCDKLKAGPPSFSVWLDKRELKPGPHWDDQIVDAIRSCESLLFIMTNDSVRSRSICKNECTRAKKYKKTIIPLLLHSDAEIPFQLENRQYIDFTVEFDVALAKLRNHLQWIRSPAGQLHALKDWLMDAEGDLQRTTDPKQQKRIQDDIDALKKQISAQQVVVADPDSAAHRVQENINRGLERERTPKEPITGISKTKFINSPPVIAPTYFQDRFVETKLIGDFLIDNAERLLTIVGRGGVGKSAMVCRLLNSLENGNLPDNGEKLTVDGIVYLSEATSKKVYFANIFSDLCQLLPQEISKKLNTVYKDAKISVTEKTLALLGAFPQGRYVVLLDNFEDKIDSETRNVHDEELDEALQAFLTGEHHGVKVILTTRVAPHHLALVESSKQFRLDLDEGLENPYAENILREMDRDGKVGLKEASDEILNEARLRTKGYPRALEALFAILSTDRDTTLPEILADAEKLLPEHVVEKLVGEAFSRLDETSQKVMQALAIFGRPVTNSAVDFLLQPYIQGIDSVYVLKRLVDMHFIRKEGSRYYLHPVDREYALSRVTKGEASDKYLKNVMFSQLILLHRGAEFFKLARLPRYKWKNIDDLAAQLAEFELRFNGDDYDTAASVLLEIDFDYLLLWGHFRLMTQLHEQLQGKISNSTLKQNSVGNLGSAYFDLGQYQQAIDCYEKSLGYAREISSRGSEGVWLGGLGNCYTVLGETQRGIEFYEQSLKIAREIGNRMGESAVLGNLGICYGNLGETKRAIEFCEQALEIKREIGDRRGETNHLDNLGQFFTDEDKFDKAIENLKQAIRIADDMGFMQSRNEARYNLSLALFCTNNLPYANELLKQARKCIYPPQNHHIGALQGLIYIFNKDFKAACEALSIALSEMESILQKTKSNYRVLDCKGLSLSGLAVCHKSEDYAKKAKQCYQKSRLI